MLGALEAKAVLEVWVLGVVVVELLEEAASQVAAILLVGDAVHLLGLELEEEALPLVVFLLQQELALQDGELRFEAVGGVDLLPEGARARDGFFEDAFELHASEVAWTRSCDSAHLRGV